MSGSFGPTPSEKGLPDQPEPKVGVSQESCTFSAGPDAVSRHTNRHVVPASPVRRTPRMVSFPTFIPRKETYAASGWFRLHASAANRADSPGRTGSVQVAPP